MGKSQMEIGYERRFMLSAGEERKEGEEPACSAWLWLPPRPRPAAAVVAGRSIADSDSSEEGNIVSVCLSGIVREGRPACFLNKALARP